jgi:hypothetical protein
MMPHTPGPWTAYADGDSTTWIRAGDKAIAWVKGGASSADVALITAAPDLLELVRQFERIAEFGVRLAERPGDTGDAGLRRSMLNLIRTTIAEATGETM